MKIAIVNDMALGVEAMRRVIVSVPGYDVVWVARNGAEAVDKCSHVRPDLILMDLLMPVMDGVEATRRIMASTPCAILVVTATVSGNISKVFDAMGCGAVDAVCTPVLGPKGNMDGAESLLTKIRTLGILLEKKTGVIPRDDSKPIARAPEHPLILIGASTGGPQALADVLSALPPDFKAAIVIVQHVDALFTPGMAEWLSGHARTKVNLATTGIKPEGGQTWLACTNDHLIFNKDLTFAYTPTPREYVYRPSIDVFFESAAKNWPGPHTAVLLTGMGRDGATGLLSLRKRKWHTIAQDQKSCVVYGMPKAAVEIGAAVEVLPVKSIASRLIQVCAANNGAVR